MRHQTAVQGMKDFEVHHMAMVLAEAREIEDKLAKDPKMAKRVAEFAGEKAEEKLEKAADLKSLQRSLS